MLFLILLKKIHVVELSWCETIFFLPCFFVDYLWTSTGFWNRIFASGKGDPYCVCSYFILRLAVCHRFPILLICWRVHFWSLSLASLRKRGVEVVQLDLTKPIEDQGPLDVIIHKLTDVILEADQNDSQSLELVHRFQEYIDAHPETIILDPLPAIRTLLDRSKSYELIRQIEAYMQDERICSPPFMELTSACGEDTLQLIEKNGLAFPFICKTRVAHGTNSHEMAIIFNQEGLKAVRPPCVIQSFINHNAVLYKVFVVGESYTVVKRPSLKNFSAGVSDRESIFFNSHNVSKPESSSVLTALDKIEGVFERPNDDVIREISKALRQALGVSLFGIDIIINNQTGQHAVIDINAFPGYEGVSEFFTDLLNHIAAVLQGQVPEVTQLNCSKLLAEQSGGIMDERICCASTGCLSVMGKDSSWIVENETNSSVKLQHQRLGCNSAVSPSFQQHCVATLATKASSQ
ncbi:inositol-tetrakisphosphate 1-kinase isoform X2 [Parus major]|uniref:inositol-tetrakisphosphate 1-kinase isoform X2 n=1 Tax=Parus major TaxID=9157 RepID=UPI0007710005|nr:inositol-tetrakisphosphate 1-kinase isoform X2 [Parus major]